MSCPDDLRHEFADTLAAFWHDRKDEIEPLAIPAWPLLAMMLESFSSVWLTENEPDDERPERDAD